MHWDRICIIWERILDEKPGVSGRGMSPGLVFHRAKRNTRKAVVFYLYATSTSE